MQLNILTYPDSRLKKISKKIEDFDEHLHKLLDSMSEVMLNNNGIGLAAIQVNYPLSALIINLPDEDGEQSPDNLIEIINPVFIEQNGETTYQEGCLSVPGFYEDVQRYDTVTLKYQDRYSNEHILETDGLLSIAIQHEIDHLLGKLFIEKLPYMKRKKFEKEYKRRLKEKKHNL